MSKYEHDWLWKNIILMSKIWPQHQVPINLLEMLSYKVAIGTIFHS